MQAAAFCLLFWAAFATAWVLATSTEARAVIQLAAALVCLAAVCLASLGYDMIGLLILATYSSVFLVLSLAGLVLGRPKPSPLGAGGGGPGSALALFGPAAWAWGSARDWGHGARAYAEVTGLADPASYQTTARVAHASLARTWGCEAALLNLFLLASLACALKALSLAPSGLGAGRGAGRVRAAARVRRAQRRNNSSAVRWRRRMWAMSTWVWVVWAAATTPILHVAAAPAAALAACAPAWWVVRQSAAAWADSGRQARDIAPFGAHRASGQARAASHAPTDARGCPARLVTRTRGPTGEPRKPEHRGPVTAPRRPGGAASGAWSRVQPHKPPQTRQPGWAASQPGWRLAPVRRPSPPANRPRRTRPNMLQKQSMVTVADATGIGWCQVIHLYGGYRQRYARPGTYVKTTIRSIFKRRIKIRGRKYRPPKVGYILRGLVTRAAATLTMPDLSRHSALSSTIIGLKKRGVFKSKHHYGPLFIGVRRRRYGSMFYRRY